MFQNLSFYEYCTVVGSHISSHEPHLVPHECHEENSKKMRHLSIDVLECK